MLKKTHEEPFKVRSHKMLSTSDHKIGLSIQLLRELPVTVAIQYAVVDVH